MRLARQNLKDTTMPTIAATAAAFETYLGFPAKRPRQAIRRLL
jgi:hypothetical protein